MNQHERPSPRMIFQNFKYTYKNKSYMMIFRLVTSLLIYTLYFNTCTMYMYMYNVLDVCVEDTKD